MLTLRSTRTAHAISCPSSPVSRMAKRTAHDSTLEWGGADAVPPPPVRTRMPGAEILEELPRATGWTLWQAVRSVQVWAGMPPAERGELFDEGAERRWVAQLMTLQLPERVENAALSLAPLYADPVRAEPLLISATLRSLSVWAEGEGALGAAALLADTGARAAPGDPQAAYHAGRTARRAGDGPAGELWLRAALSLARQQKDGISRAQALTGLGNLYLGRGRLPLAERMHLRALRAARRARVPALEGMALHDLAVVATERDHLEQAERWAGEAVRVYGERHPRLPALAHDTAYIWMLRGDFPAALPVFQALLPHFTSPDDRVRVTAHVARAAGGAGERAAFEIAWAEVIPVLQTTREEAALSLALSDAAFELAHGALAIGDPARAEWIAAWALDAARRFGRGKQILTAESVLDAARRARSGKGRVEQAARAEAPERTAVARELVTSLRAMAGAAG